MGKRTLKVKDSQSPKKKLTCRLNELSGAGTSFDLASGSSEDSLTIDIRKYADTGSIYKSDIFAEKELIQYLCTGGGNSKKYLVFRLKYYMSLLFEKGHVNDDTLPATWQRFEETFQSAFQFVSKAHKDEDGVGHVKNVCGF